MSLLSLVGDGGWGMGDGGWGMGDGGWGMGMGDGGWEGELPSVRRRYTRVSERNEGLS